MRLVLQTVEKARIPNFLIVAIDTQLRDYLTEKGVNVYYKDIQACLLRHGPATSPWEMVVTERFCFV